MNLKRDYVEKKNKFNGKNTWFDVKLTTFQTALVFTQYRSEIMTCYGISLFLLCFTITKNSKI
jgi:hypothetical protein